MYLIELPKSPRGESLTLSRGGETMANWRALRGQMREGEIAPEVVASGAWQRE